MGAIKDRATRANDEGFAARLRGLPITACPHQDGLAQYWRKGWQEAESRVVAGNVVLRPDQSIRPT